MAWYLVSLFFFLSLFVYVGPVLNIIRSYTNNFSFVFYSKNLLNKNSKLSFIYLGRRCTFVHPHLKQGAYMWICSVLIEIETIIWVVILQLLSLQNDLTHVLIIGITNLSLYAIAMIPFAFIPEFQDKKIISTLYKMDKKELANIAKKILEQYPSFFDDTFR